MKKTGIELISQERKDQINKHGRSVEDDIEDNVNGQLIAAARILKQENPPLDIIPSGWNIDIWQKMFKKNHYQRLIISGALLMADSEAFPEQNHEEEINEIAEEIDRINTSNEQ